MSKLTETYELSNGVKIPKIGFGTWQVPNGQVAYDAVAEALSQGYRHIDTAWQYGNEESVGRAIRDSGLNREDVFVTSKLAAAAKSYDAAMKTFDETMDRIGLDYLDLYLIHAPWPWDEMGADYSTQNIEVWQAMEDIYKTGKVRAIGISNFNVADQKNILKHATIMPMVNQIQYYIGYTEPDITFYAQDHNMLVEAFSPLATGYLLNNEAVKDIAAHYDVSVAQLAIRYVLQHGLLPLPKATNSAHIENNKQVEFEISVADMAVLDKLKDTAPGEDHNG
ncbi:aldo/keto reductase [Secundilactobacillus malefermentans]|uniref:aldo/keto reductase n=1 Tax=Secundilactobacillus malefermentans TaxID=176292 RepID=UPI0011C9D0A0|nr:aldo/keto reductase [Secundilactobacillus malefermentans]QEA31242.1 aldo/keto reductase [Secundilactobacillus malefermentans]